MRPKENHANVDVARVTIDDTWDSIIKETRAKWNGDVTG